MIRNIVGHYCTGARKAIFPYGGSAYDGAVGTEGCVGQDMGKVPDFGSFSDCYIIINKGGFM